MLFDTHCHLNFSRFEKNVDEVILRAKEAGVEHIVVPGTDIETSKRAVEIAEKFPNIYAAVGIHPHHVFELFSNQSTKIFPQVNSSSNIRFLQDFVSLLEKIESLLKSKKVVAVGEIGIDRHFYEKTKHKNYKVDEAFVDLQKEFFIAQVQLTDKYKKTLIIHNREAKKDVLEILTKYSSLITGRSVFHCCEPDLELLDFAKKHKIFIGVDGDVTYWAEKQKFIKKVPLEMLVLETDSPFLLPEPLRSQKLYPNEPRNVKIVAEFVVKLKNISIKKVEENTTKNGKKLFNL